MSAPILIAYDGTPHAEDAIALARALSSATGAPLALAHVYRAEASGSPSVAPTGRTEFLRKQAEAVLDQGASVLGDPAVQRHAVAGTTTATALRRLAAEVGASAIVLGSAHNVAPGRVHPGSAARRLLQGAPCAVAFAPAGYRERSAGGAGSAQAACDDAERSAARTAELLAHAGLDLLVVGSAPAAPAGRVVTNAARDQVIQASTVPVLVLAGGQIFAALDAAAA